MWNEPRKSYRSPQKTNKVPRLSTTCLATPGKADKGSVRQITKQCPLHFNQTSHICYTCRKSICLRCALTYCQQHIIRTEAEALFQLRQELIRLEITPKIQEISNKLEQSKERQAYLQKKVLRLIQGIQSHFEYIAQLLVKKKLEIIQFYDLQFQRYLEEHRRFDEEMKRVVEWLRGYSLEEGWRLSTIEDVDGVSAAIRQTSVEEGRAEKKLTRLLMGKDKIRIQKYWSEENLEKVLFQIDNIPYRIGQVNKTPKRKKRLTTQNLNDHHNPTNLKSNSHSKFPSGRKLVTPST